MIAPAEEKSNLITTVLTLTAQRRTHSTFYEDLPFLEVYNWEDAASQFGNAIQHKGIFAKVPNAL